VAPAPSVSADYDEPTVSPTEIDDEAVAAPPARDPFLDQLRQAVDESDDDDDTTRAMEAFFEPDTDDRRSRFGRRR
jgi:hypothetical protein